MQGQLQGVPGVLRGACGGKRGAPGMGTELSLRKLGSVQPPFAVMLSFRERGEQRDFMHVYLAQHLCALGAVVNCSFLSKWQEQGCEKAFKPPLWSHVLSLIGVCLSRHSRQHLKALKLTSRLPRRPSEAKRERASLQGTVLAL